MSLGASPLGQYPLGTDGVISSGSGVSVSVAVTDGADVLAAQIDPNVSASSASTDGADILAASVNPQVSVSSATTDGADTLAGLIDPLVSVSSATTDGADVLAASVTVGGAFSVSANWTDGADTLAASIDALISVSSASTDGADVLSGLIGPQIGVASSAIDGADVLAAVVTPLDTIAFSAALLDGADTLVANIVTAPSDFGLAKSDGDEYRHKRKEKDRRRKTIAEQIEALFPEKVHQELIQRPVVAKTIPLDENTIQDDEENELLMLML